MAGGKEFGRWFRKERLRRGFKSAAELSRRAGLSISYVSALERGHAKPKAESMTSLAVALDMTGDEAGDFFRRAKVAGEPAAVRDAIASGTPPPPGVAVWSHLPALLLDKHDEGRGADEFLADEALFNVVRASASALGFVAWKWWSKPKHVLAELRSRYDAARASLEARRTPDDGDPALEAARFLPAFWRQIIFRTNASSSVRASMISSWSYCPTAVYGVPRISLRFAKFDALHGFDRIDVELACEVHDAIVAWWAANALELVPAPMRPLLDEELQPELYGLTAHVQWIRDIDPAALARQLADNATEWTDASQHEQETRFATRLFEAPPFAVPLFGTSDDATRRQYIDKCNRVSEVIGTAVRRPPPDGHSAAVRSPIDGNGR